MTMPSWMPVVPLILSTISIIISIFSAVFAYKTYKANIEPNLLLGNSTSGKIEIHNLGARVVLVSLFIEFIKYDGHIMPMKEEEVYWNIDPHGSKTIDISLPMFGNSELVHVQLEYIYGSTRKSKYPHCATILSTKSKGSYLLFQGNGSKKSDLSDRKKMIDRGVELGIDYKLIMAAAPE